MAVSNLLQSAIGYPIEISSFNKHPNSNDNDLCRLAGFSVTFLSLVSIFHLVGISLERFAILRFPFKVRVAFKNPKFVLFIVIPSWFTGFIFSIPPLFGWSEYKRLQPDDFACQLDIESRSWSSLSYLWSLLIMGFALPVFVITVTSIVNIRKVKALSTDVATLGLTDRHTAIRRLNERNMTLMVLAIIAAFLIAWLPYALCVIIYTNNGSVSDEFLNFATLLAKTSTIYNPIIFTIRTKLTRNRFYSIKDLRSSFLSNIRLSSLLIGRMRNDSVEDDEL